MYLCARMNVWESCLVWALKSRISTLFWFWFVMKKKTKNHTELFIHIIHYIDESEWSLISWIHEIVPCPLIVWWLWICVCALFTCGCKQPNPNPILLHMCCYYCLLYLLTVSIDGFVAAIFFVVWHNKISNQKYTIFANYNTLLKMSLFIFLLFVFSLTLAPCLNPTVDNNFFSKTTSLSFQIILRPIQGLVWFSQLFNEII